MDNPLHPSSCETSSNQDSSPKKQIKLGVVQSSTPGSRNVMGVSMKKTRWDQAPDGDEEDDSIEINQESHVLQSETDKIGVKGLIKKFEDFTGGSSATEVAKSNEKPDTINTVIGRPQTPTRVKLVRTNFMKTEQSAPTVTSTLQVTEKLDSTSNTESPKTYEKEKDPSTASVSASVPVTCKALQIISSCYDSQTDDSSPEDETPSSTEERPSTDSVSSLEKLCEQKQCSKAKSDSDTLLNNPEELKSGQNIKTPEEQICPNIIDSSKTNYNENCDKSSIISVQSDQTNPTNQTHLEESKSGKHMHVSGITQVSTPSTAIIQEVKDNLEILNPEHNKSLSMPTAQQQGGNSKLTLHSKDQVSSKEDNGKHDILAKEVKDNEIDKTDIIINDEVDATMEEMFFESGKTGDFSDLGGQNVTDVLHSKSVDSSKKENAIVESANIDASLDSTKTIQSNEVVLQTNDSLLELLEAENAPSSSKNKSDEVKETDIKSILEDIQTVDKDIRDKREPTECSVENTASNKDSIEIKSENVSDAQIKSNSTMCNVNELNTKVDNDSRLGNDECVETEFMTESNETIMEDSTVKERDISPITSGDILRKKYSDNISYVNSPDDCDTQPQLKDSTKEVGPTEFVSIKEPGNQDDQSVENVEVNLIKIYDMSPDEVANSSADDNLNECKRTYDKFEQNPSSPPKDNAVKETVKDIDSFLNNANANGLEVSSAASITEVHHIKVTNGDSEETSESIEPVEHIDTEQTTSNTSVETEFSQSLKSSESILKSASLDQQRELGYINNTNEELMDDYISADINKLTDLQDGSKVVNKIETGPEQLNNSKMQDIKDESLEMVSNTNVAKHIVKEHEQTGFAKILESVKEDGLKTAHSSSTDSAEVTEDLKKDFKPAVIAKDSEIVENAFETIEGKSENNDLAEKMDESSTLNNITEVPEIDQTIDSDVTIALENESKLTDIVEVPGTAENGNTTTKSYLTDNIEVACIINEDPKISVNAKTLERAEDDLKANDSGLIDSSAITMDIIKTAEEMDKYSKLTANSGDSDAVNDVIKLTDSTVKKKMDENAESNDIEVPENSKDCIKVVDHDSSHSPKITVNGTNSTVDSIETKDKATVEVTEKMCVDSNYSVVDGQLVNETDDALETTDSVIETMDDVVESLDSFLITTTDIDKTNNTETTESNTEDKVAEYESNLNLIQTANIEGKFKECAKPTSPNVSEKIRMTENIEQEIKQTNSGEEPEKVDDSSTSDSGPIQKVAEDYIDVELKFTDNNDVREAMEEGPRITHNTEVLGNVNDGFETSNSEEKQRVEENKHDLKLIDTNYDPENTDTAPKPSVKADMVEKVIDCSSTTVSNSMLKELEEEEKLPFNCSSYISDNIKEDHKLTGSTQVPEQMKDEEQKGTGADDLENMEEDLKTAESTEVPEKDSHGPKTYEIDRQKVEDEDFLKISGKANVVENVKDHKSTHTARVQEKVKIDSVSNSSEVHKLDEDRQDLENTKEYTNTASSTKVLEQLKDCTGSIDSNKTSNNATDKFENCSDPTKSSVELSRKNLKTADSDITDSTKVTANIEGDSKPPDSAEDIVKVDIKNTDSSTIQVVEGDTEVASDLNITELMMQDSTPFSGVSQTQVSESNVQETALLEQDSKLLIGAKRQDSELPEETVLVSNTMMPEDIRDYSESSNNAKGPIKSTEIPKSTDIKESFERNLKSCIKSRGPDKEVESIDSSTSGNDVPQEVVDNISSRETKEEVSAKPNTEPKAVQLKEAMTAKLSKLVDKLASTSDSPPAELPQVSEPVVKATSKPKDVPPPVRVSARQKQRQAAAAAALAAEKAKSSPELVKKGSAQDKHLDKRIKKSLSPTKELHIKISTKPLEVSNQSPVTSPRTSESKISPMSPKKVSKELGQEKLEPITLKLSKEDNPVIVKSLSPKISSLSPQTKTLGYTLKIAKDSTTIIPKDPTLSPKGSDSPSAHSSGKADSPSKVGYFIKDTGLTITPISSENQDQKLNRPKITLKLSKAGSSEVKQEKSETWKAIQKLGEIDIMPVEGKSSPESLKRKEKSDSVSPDKKIKLADVTVEPSTSSGMSKLQGLLTQAPLNHSDDSNDVQFIGFVPPTEKVRQTPPTPQYDIGMLKPEMEPKPVLPKKRGRPRKISSPDREQQYTHTLPPGLTAKDILAASLQHQTLQQHLQMQQQVQHMQQMQQQQPQALECTPTMFPVPLFDLSEDTYMDPPQPALLSPPTLFPDQVQPETIMRSARGRPIGRSRRSRGTSLFRGSERGPRGRPRGSRGMKRMIEEMQSIVYPDMDEPITLDNIDSQMGPRFSDQQHASQITEKTIALLRKSIEGKKENQEKRQRRSDGGDDGNRDSDIDAKVREMKEKIEAAYQAELKSPRKISPEKKKTPEKLQSSEKHHLTESSKNSSDVSLIQKKDGKKQTEGSEVEKPKRKSVDGKSPNTIKRKLSVDKSEDSPKIKFQDGNADDGSENILKDSQQDLEDMDVDQPGSPEEVKPEVKVEPEPPPKPVKPRPKSKAEIKRIKREKDRLRREAKKLAALEALKAAPPPPEEDTRMSASDPNGDMIDGDGSKKPRMEVDGETKEFTVEQIAEYQWPLQGGELYMIQEQISTYLGVKSFKRKYPEIKRRPVEMEERTFLCDSGLVSESMCDLGLTAVSSSEVLDIMFQDFQDQYEELRKCMREKQARELINKQKEKKKFEQSLSKSDLKEHAIQSSQSWNQMLNRSRTESRKCHLDLQTWTVQYPRGKWPQMTRPVAKLGNYPLALIPGQYCDYYKEYTPQELRYWPVNTVLYGPLQPNERHSNVGSEGSQSESEDSSSSDDSSDSSSDEATECEERERGERSGCKACGGGKRVGEGMVSCSQCGHHIHVSCADLTSGMLARVRSYAWQCSVCKTCEKCDKAESESKMLFCDACDRGYHSYCVGLKRVPYGSWTCQLCRDD